MIYRSFLSVVVVLLLTVGAAGQSTTGTITGTVSDVSGAVLPGVEVTVINEGTNLTRNLITNESGNYTAPQLPIGRYRVEALLPGFQTAVQSGIGLNVDQRARIDLVLQVGQVTEIVEVTAEAPLIQTEDSAVGTVIDRQKISELPLNGRNFESLVLLIPEAVTAAQGSHLAARGGVVIAGLDEHYQSYYVDGVDNVDTIVRNFAYRPSIDAIEEFKVQSTGYAAEFGRNAGAVVNVTTRSGTNEFHGALFDYHRNKALNTSTKFAKDAGLEKEGFLRNQYGGTLGGPIVRDRVFFFFAYEAQRQREQIIKRATVPTALMRNGDLSEIVGSGTLTDPTTGLPFPNNIIPANRINPLAKEALGFWPVANAGGTSRNLTTAGNKTENYDNISIKIDTAFTDVHRLAARYSYANEFIFNPYGSETSSGRNLPNFGQWNPRYRTSSGANLTSVFSPAFINEFRVGFNRFAQPLTDVYNSLTSLVGEERIPLPPIMAAIPRNRDGFDTFNLSGTVENLGSGGGFHRLNNTWNLIDAVTINTGNHSFKLGVDYRKMDFHNITGNTNGYTFNGDFTGQPYGDFLLGYPITTTTQTGIQELGIPPREYGRERVHQFAAYVQDDWKVNPDLTINWGLRWEYYNPLTALNGLSGWLASDNKVHVICREAYEVECGKSVVDPNLFVIQDDGNGILPQGLTIPDKNNFAPRFGLAWSPGGSNSVIRASYGVFYDSDDRHKSFCCVKGAPFNKAFSFRATNFNDLDLAVDPFPQAIAASGSLTAGAFDPNSRDTYAQRWNLGVQHQLAGSLMFDVSYVGSLTLKSRRSRRVNQPLQPGPGGVSGRRTFQPFGRLTLTENSGKSNFHSLQAKLEQRFASGLTFINSFMWGKALDNRATGSAGGASIQNYYDMDANYGPSSFDVRMKYSFSYVYELPQGSNAFTRGWQVSGIVLAQSGRPVTPRLGANVANVGNTSYPDRICDGKLSNPTEDKWFDTSCFVKPAAFTYGNSGTGILTSDGFFNWDMSVTKNTQLLDERVNVQFRLEMFNLTDHVNYGFPETRVDRSTAGSIGTLLGNPTQVQLGLRIVY